MIDIHTIVIPKWFIIGYDNYFFGEDKKLYNFKTQKELKPKLKGYTIGYNLNGKFISRIKLRQLLTKKTNEYVLPF